MKKTAKCNILGAVQAKDNNNDTNVVLALPTLKKNKSTDNDYIAQFREDTAGNGGVGNGGEGTGERRSGGGGD